MAVTQLSGVRAVWSRLDCQTDTPAAPTKGAAVRNGMHAALEVCNSIPLLGKISGVASIAYGAAEIVYGVGKALLGGALGLMLGRSPAAVDQFASKEVARNIVSGATIASLGAAVVFDPTMVAGHVLNGIAAVKNTTDVVNNLVPGK